jgi:hypothetical protein
VNKSKINKVQYLQEVLADCPFEALLPFKAAVVQVTPEYDIYLKLDRKQIYSSAITKVLKAGDRYGHCSSLTSILQEADTQPNLKASINVACLSENADWPAFSVSHLRSLLLSEHVSALLQANG